MLSCAAFNNVTRGCPLEIAGKKGNGQTTILSKTDTTEAIKSILSRTSISAIQQLEIVECDLIHSVAFLKRDHAIFLN